MNKSLSTADDILACARSLIVAGGYNGFSYADIAEVVGIRKPSIHHHFPSKLDLVKTLVIRYREAAEEGIANLERAVPGPLDQLRAYIGYWKTCIGDASAPFCVCALLANELPVLPEEIALEIRAYFRFLSGWLTAVLERGAALGVVALTDTPRVEAEAFMATVHGAMLSARAYGDTTIFGTIMDPQLARLSAGA
ncbi:MULTISPECIES: TetR/AcrR family transcriptional regulator [Massilia]|jgi:TetR/AcrR family transcriptional repressor of nem operon|uniref:TetR family transcriptional regulator n=2 Tax=Massilia TaxID=149698 RepID=A0A7X3G3J7_9BURK|nr:MULTISPECIES: TetR/AcrR family transcriptional regulator [Telluria group]KQX95689.1 TetR family transcriptional regulator [Massilia sp. Root133]KQZ35037.1 TetR family transcriptional regulator [Massilia sp. Root1485]MDN4040711.1 TetR/AcrR family transcriptional regulator [Massilia sp. YIM B02787]MVW62978.1 TetR family transcriptional regulator [Telluria cellulosilytica]